jgi:hypothetical protein
VRDIKTTCDVCGSKGERYSSFFDLDNRSIGRSASFQFIGGGLAKSVWENRVSWEGCGRYAKYIDLCSLCRDEIVKSVQSAIDKMLDKSPTSKATAQGDD